jgi:glycosyltransferase involved in cell wall biosynthesis
MDVRISILIPTYNRASELDITLKSLLLHIHGVDYKQDVEILVIDNNSSDETRIVAERYGKDKFIHYLLEKRQGKNFALNLGIERAWGELLIFVDDDICPHDNWLNNIVKSSSDWPDNNIFGGQVIPRFPGNTPNWVVEGKFAAFVFAIHSPQKHEGIYESEATPSGPNCWIKKRLFDKGIRYDTNIGPKGKGRVSGSELEFFNRMKETGNIPVYIPGASVDHRIQTFQTSKRYLLKRSFASGTGYAYIYGFEGVSRICGIPRYLFKQFFYFILSGVANLLRFKGKVAFEFFMDASHRLGCISACINKIDKV